MGVLVHPQLGLRFGAALPGFFVSPKNNTLNEKHYLLMISNYFFIKIELICY